MSWTGRGDRDPCCGEQPGAVDDGETVVRLLHNRIEEPDYEPFSRKELMAPASFTNVCGDADGLSVTRLGDLTTADIISMADSLAALRPGRVGRGALNASVEDVRRISLPNLDGQVCFVYDDPMVSNRMHAVIRIREDLPRPDVDEVRVKLRWAFSQRILPPSANDAGPGQVVMQEGALQVVLPPERT